MSGSGHRSRPAPHEGCDAAVQVTVLRVEASTPVPEMAGTGVGSSGTRFVAGSVSHEDVLRATGGQLMKPADFSQSRATWLAFRPSTLTFLLRAVSVAVSSFAAMPVNTCSSCGYFCANCERMVIAGL